MEKANVGKLPDSWSGTLLWYLFYSVCLPVTVPLIIYHVLFKSKYKKMQEKLHGKVVLITGASSGLGRSLSHSFYRLGCKVILASRRKEELENVRDSLLRTHVTIPTHPPVVLPLDLSDINTIPTHVANVLDIFGQVDILVNNGGISYRGEIEATSVNVDIEVMLVNYFGQVALTKALLPSMIQRRSGQIVAISSMQGKIAIPYRSAYSASKHALQAFCDILRAEVARHNISVCVVSPGYIRTDLSLNALTGNGQKYGVMDVTTDTGYPPEQVAEQIVRAVTLKKKELILSPVAPRLAMYLRIFAPSLYFWLMKKRAQNLVKANKRD